MTSVDVDVFAGCLRNRGDAAVAAELDASDRAPWLIGGAHRAQTGS